MKSALLFALTAAASSSGDGELAPFSAIPLDAAVTLQCGLAGACRNQCNNCEVRNGPQLEECLRGLPGTCRIPASVLHQPNQYLHNWCNQPRVGWVFYLPIAATEVWEVIGLIQLPSDAYYTGCGRGEVYGGKASMEDLLTCRFQPYDVVPLRGVGEPPLQISLSEIFETFPSINSNTSSAYKAVRVFQECAERPSSVLLASLSYTGYFYGAQPIPTTTSTTTTTRPGGGGPDDGSTEPTTEEERRRSNVNPHFLLMLGSLPLVYMYTFLVAGLANL